MPTFHISGGGDALQTALNQIVANQTNTFIIQDGTYDSILFSSSTISAASSITNVANTKIILSSENGPNNCIIDGGTKWENDIFDSTLLSAGKPCLSVDNTFYSSIPLTCYGITFRNGYCGQQNGASGVCLQSGNYKTFSNCVFERCAGSVSASNAFCSVIRYGGNIIRAIIRNCVGNRGAATAKATYLTNCIVENIRTLNAATVFEETRFYNCVVRNINNGNQSLTSYSTDIKQCLFYNLSKKNRLFSSCRGNFYGNTVILPTAVTAEIITWNTTSKLYVANNIFNTGQIRAISASPEIIVVNNYCRNAFGDATRISGNVLNTNLDPGFVDAVNENFRLLSSSPCISAGSYEWLDSYYSKRDLDKNLYKNPPSIGAYQFDYLKEVIPNDEYPLGTI